MLQGEHSAILLTCIKIFVLSIFEWPLKTGFTVHNSCIINATQIISTYFVLLAGLGNLHSVSGTPEFDLELVYSPYLLEEHTV